MIIFYNFLIIFLLIICILCSVAFFTLLERKLLASIQNRRGPNKIGLFGILQPIADGMKLIFKEIVIPRVSMSSVFVLSPVLAFVLGFVSWSFLPISLNSLLCNSEYGIFFIFIISILHVYSIILAGWSSNSKYSFLGALRSSAQLISYDISIGFILLIIVMTVKSLRLIDILEFQTLNGYLFFYYPILFFFFFICAVAETSRHPFDLPEAEAELVSGYNVEYSSIGFACFFLGEYSSILFMVFFMIIIFFGGWFWDDFTFTPAIFNIFNENTAEKSFCKWLLVYLFYQIWYFFFTLVSSLFFYCSWFYVYMWLFVKYSNVFSFYYLILAYVFPFIKLWLSLIFVLFDVVKPIFFIYLFILIRGALPRYRYDQLMRLGWKIILPSTFSLFVFYSFIFYNFS